MLQRLPIAAAQVKAGNTSEYILNEIHQIIYYLYQAKEITKKVNITIFNKVIIQNGSYIHLIHLILIGYHSIFQNWNSIYGF